jgi:hypothetical protein
VGITRSPPSPCATGQHYDHGDQCTLDAAAPEKMMVTSFWTTQNGEAVRLCTSAFLLMTVVVESPSIPVQNQLW